MNILIIGSGGRECTFAWKLSQSEECGELFIAPGNAGTSDYGTNIDIGVTDFPAIETFCLEEKIEMVVVGPEVPLVEGIYDHFQAEHLQHINVVGPSKEGAQLEGSKAYAKAFMARHEIPTAGYLEVSFANIDAGVQRIRSTEGPYVLKADGLAAGKGVLIIDDKEEAAEALLDMIGGRFGEASGTVVIEEFLDGIEFSVFVLTDGSSYQILPIAKDYKRIGEGDTGLNTGGMGAVSPVPFVDETLYKKVIDQIVEPTINGLVEEDIVYKGFVFIGLISVNGAPFVIEYNCRMGDPETEVVLPRMKSDLLPMLASLHDASLDEYEVDIDDRAASTVMLVSGGYPEAYEKGKSIYIPKNINKASLLFHAGTKMQGQMTLTNGGRVLAITSFGETHKDAVATSLDIADEIDFDGKFYRKDIGQDV